METAPDGYGGVTDGKLSAVSNGEVHMKRMIPALALAVALPCGAQDAKSWLESQGLDAIDTKTVQDLEVVVARLKGAKDSKAGEDRVVIIAKGKPVWQSNPKETDPGSRWTLHTVGKDLDGDG